MCEKKKKHICLPSFCHLFLYSIENINKDLWRSYWSKFSEVRINIFQIIVIVLDLFQTFAIEINSSFRFEFFTIRINTFKYKFSKLCSILNLSLVKYYSEENSNGSSRGNHILRVLLESFGRKFENIHITRYRDFWILEYSSISNISILIPNNNRFSTDLDRWAGYGLRRSCVRWINFRTRSLAIRIGVSDTSIRFATSTSSIGIGPPSTRYFTITRAVAGSVARSTFLSMSSPRRSSSTSWASWPPTNSGTYRADLFIHQRRRWKIF